MKNERALRQAIQSSHSSNLTIISQIIPSSTWQGREGSQDANGGLAGHSHTVEGTRNVNRYRISPECSAPLLSLPIHILMCALSAAALSNFSARSVLVAEPRVIREKQGCYRRFRTGIGARFQTDEGQRRSEARQLKPGLAAFESKVSSVAAPN